MGTPSKGGPLLNVVGAGTKGISELAAKLDPTTVTFALCRVVLGSGSLARDKCVCLHVNPETCPGIRRGRINGRKGDVRKALGEVNAELSFDDVSSVTLENVLSEMSKFMASDSGGAGVSLAKLREDYEAMIAKASAAGGAGDGKSSSGVALTRKTAAELGDVKADAALKAVRDPMGAFNWFLCDSEFAFINAGSLSVPEMQKWLKPDAVCFGLLRMGFGSGRFRRTKWVYIVWSGPSVGPVKRAKAASARGAMKAKLGHSSVDIEATCAEDASLEAIIDKVRRATAVDGDEVSTADGDPFSVDKFMEALKEEAAASGDFFGDSGLVVGEGSSATTKSAETLIKELHTAGHATNWVAFTVNV